MTRIGAFVVTTLTFLLFSSSILQSQEYDIRLFRAAKVGEKYRVLSTARQTESMAVLVDNKIVKNTSEAFTIELVSTVTVLEIDGHGKAIRRSLEIEKCDFTARGNTKSLIAAGAVVLASLEKNQIVWKINDTLADPLTAKALNAAITADRGGPSDDEVFGTREKKKIGDTWKINTDVVDKTLRERLNVQSSGVAAKGATAFEGVSRNGQEEHLLISAWISSENFLFPLPGGLEMITGELKAVFSGRFPVNQSRKPLEQSANMIMRFNAISAATPERPAMTVNGIIGLEVTAQTLELN